MARFLNRKFSHWNLSNSLSDLVSKNASDSQARRQDLAAWGGSKTRRGRTHFKNAVLDVCSNRWAKCDMGGAGTTGPPPLATALLTGSNTDSN